MTTFFPQFANGSVCQFPYRRITRFRTIYNAMEDGSRFVLQDPAFSGVRWSLAFSQLSDSERIQLQAFFDTVQGRLLPFLFLDPDDNLLKWSEILTQTTWQTSPLLNIQDGTSDPLGTRRASTITNTASAPGGLTQIVGIPGSILLCLSLYARSLNSSEITLIRDSGATTRALSPTWERFSIVQTSSDGSNSSRLGFSISPGASVDVFGVQLKAQASPSQYVATMARSGIYPGTRFETDSLTFTSTAPNNHSCDFTLYSKLSG